MGSRIINFFRLCRPEQYYKNLLVFLAIFFSGNLFRADYLFLVIIGFISLCLMSSVNYIVNDITDRDRDKHNKEKADRPLAKGKITVFQAVILAFVLLIIGVLIAVFLNLGFLLAMLAFFLISSLYSFFLKNELFLDIIAIAVNFVIRAVSGALIIRVWISPWLILGTFFLALFMVVGKRNSEIIFLKSSAKKHRVVLEKYSENVLNALMQITTSLLLVAYALYCFLTDHQLLLITLPVIFYAVLRYLHLIYSGSDKVRITHKIFSDYRILVSGVIYIILTALILYFDKIIG